MRELAARNETGQTVTQAAWPVLHPCGISALEHVGLRRACYRKLGVKSRGQLNRFVREALNGREAAPLRT